MQEGPVIAIVAALIGDPARANMLTALLDGRALTVGELGRAADVTLPTASGHVAKLEAARLVIASKQGRHRYVSLSGPDVAQVLEGLMGLAQRTGAVRLRTGPKDASLRAARVCYDHLAGETGVALLDGLQRKGVLTVGPTITVTDLGRRLLNDIGIDTGAHAGRRPLCRACLDWSERRSHLGGALGAALLEHILEHGWMRREEGRALSITPLGETAFYRTFSVVLQANTAC
jgi:DNA-binding transcriptional ArsR family regulator